VEVVLFLLAPASSSSRQGIDSGVQVVRTLSSESGTSWLMLTMLDRRDRTRFRRKSGCTTLVRKRAVT
jgi:hypothetical protein